MRPVGVPVVGDAEIGAAVDHGALEPLDMRRADAVVDVHAVRFGADHRDVGAGIGEDARRHARGRAIRAVEHDAEAAKRHRTARTEGREEVERVAVLGVGEPVDVADGAAGRPQHRPVELRLDLVFDRVGQLVPAAGEDLDAVVGGGVVRGGDHHPEVGVDVGGEERRSRGGDDAGILDIDAACGEARGDRRPEELARDPRITREHRDRAPPARSRGVGDEHAGSGLRERERPFRSEEAVREAADPVGSEQSSHRRLRADQRFEYCGALRAFLRPAFLRSFARASRARNPAFLSAGRLLS